MRGGDMHTPDCDGYIRLDDNKKYLAVKSGLLCYYNNDNVSCVEMCDSLEGGHYCEHLLILDSKVPNSTVYQMHQHI